LKGVGRILAQSKSNQRVYGSGDGEHEISSCRRKKRVVTLVLMVAVMESTRGVVAERGKVCIALVVMVAVMESTRVVVAEGGKVCIALVVMVAVMEITRVVVAEGGKVWLH
jgi:hypothetical protein